MTIYTSSTLIGGEGRAGQVCFTLCLRDQRSMWMQDGCKVYMASYMASSGSCFMVTWTISKNHFLEVGAHTNLGDHGTPNAHNRWFVLLYQVRGSAWIAIHWNNIWLRAQHIWLHTTLEDPWPHHMMLGGVLGRPLDTFFWALTFSWSRLLARVWSGPLVKLTTSNLPRSDKRTIGNDTWSL